jgi:anaerobic dimethyl sulfoxide reductase subunit B (iron-sulfur subunit)
MRVYQWEKGVFPDVRLRILPVMCYHCENPVCVKACESKALYKEDTYGAVLVASEKCQGCRKCWQACPYGAPQYDGDALGAKMSKCDMCIERLGGGLKPMCVLSCSMRALEFGPLSELMERYGDLRRLEHMPKESITRPAVVLKPADEKLQVVPWDSKGALELWKKRGPESGGAMPDVFAEISDVIEAPTDIVGRNKLVLKAKSCDELMYHTTDNE